MLIQMKPSKVEKALKSRSLPRTGRTDLLGVRLKPDTIALAKQLALGQSRTLGDVVERSIETYSLLSGMTGDEQFVRQLEAFLSSKVKSAASRKQSGPDLLLSVLLRFAPEDGSKPNVDPYQAAEVRPAPAGSEPDANRSEQTSRKVTRTVKFKGHPTSAGSDRHAQRPSGKPLRGN